MELEIDSRSPAATQRTGAWLGERLASGSVVLLSGTLGSGKTHLAQGIAQGLGVREYVTSPTFTLINEYRSGRVPLYHIDLYRLRNEAEAESLGLDDYLYGHGICVVEWYEQAPSLMPDEFLRVALSYGSHPEQRHLCLEARGERYAAVLRDMAAATATGAGSGWS